MTLTLALVSLLNWKLGFKYTPFDHENMDIVIPLESCDGLYKYTRLAMKEFSISSVSGISIEYCNYIEAYLKKTTSEKVAFLSNFLEK